MCFLLVFEWPVLADPVGGSNWANHRVVGGNFNGMGWSSVLYQPLPGAEHVGELLARSDGSLARAIDWVGGPDGRGELDGEPAPGGGGFSGGWAG